MKKVLVTGATGFIGNYVVEELLGRGCLVIATSADEPKAKQTPWFNRVNYLPFDLAAFDPTGDYYDFFQHPDLVIHLAWEGLPNYDSSFHFDINLPRHFAFLSNLIDNGLNDLTVTGTCFEYGIQEGSLKEDMPVFPNNFYAKAKNELRRKLEALSNDHPISLKWLRLFYMYGEGQNPNSLFSQLDNALLRGEKQFNMSGGEQVRDYLPVEKVARYIVTVALQKKVTGVINISSGQGITIKEFVKDYLKKKNKTITLNFGIHPYSVHEPMRFWGDHSKLMTIISES